MSTTKIAEGKLVPLDGKQLIEVSLEHLIPTGNYSNIKIHAGLTREVRVDTDKELQKEYDDVFETIEGVVGAKGDQYLRELGLKED